MFTLLALMFNPLQCDAPEPWQLGFQDGATPTYEGITELHNSIFFYLVVIFIGVTWVIGSIVVNFSHNKNPIVYKYLNHGTKIELIWTITPASASVIVCGWHKLMDINKLRQRATIKLIVVSFAFIKFIFQYIKYLFKLLLPRLGLLLIYRIVVELWSLVLCRLIGLVCFTFVVGHDLLDFLKDGVDYESLSKLFNTLYCHDYMGIPDDTLTTLLNPNDNAVHYMNGSEMNAVSVTQQRNMSTSMLVVRNKPGMNQNSLRERCQGVPGVYPFRSASHDMVAIASIDKDSLDSYSKTVIEGTEELLREENGGLITVTGFFKPEAVNIVALNSPVLTDFLQKLNCIELGNILSFIGYSNTSTSLSNAIFERSLNTRISEPFFYINYQFGMGPELGWAGELSVNGLLKEVFRIQLDVANIDYDYMDMAYSDRLGISFRRTRIRYVFYSSDFKSLMFLVYGMRHREDLNYLMVMDEKFHMVHCWMDLTSDMMTEGHPFYNPRINDYIALLMANHCNDITRLDTLHGMPKLKFVV
jgi:heme/copper-type cytochrome/quinol oxidase subunit 2